MLKPVKNNPFLNIGSADHEDTDHSQEEAKFKPAAEKKESSLKSFAARFAFQTLWTGVVSAAVCTGVIWVAPNMINPPPVESSLKDMEKFYKDQEYAREGLRLDITNQLERLSANLKQEVDEKLKGFDQEWEERLIKYGQILNNKIESKISPVEQRLEAIEKNKGASVSLATQDLNRIYEKLTQLDEQYQALATKSTQVAAAPIQKYVPGTPSANQITGEFYIVKGLILCDMLLKAEKNLSSKHLNILNNLKEIIDHPATEFNKTDYNKLGILLRQIRGKIEQAHTQKSDQKPFNAGISELLSSLITIQKTTEEQGPIQAPKTDLKDQMTIRALVTKFYSILSSYLISQNEVALSSSLAQPEMSSPVPTPMPKVSVEQYNAPKTDSSSKEIEEILAPRDVVPAPVEKAPEAQGATGPQSAIAPNAALEASRPSTPEIAKVPQIKNEEDLFINLEEEKTENEENDSENTPTSPIISLESMHPKRQN